MEKTGLDLWVFATFWSRSMISRGFEAVNTVFGGYFVFGKKKPRCDVVKHGAYTGLWKPGTGPFLVGLGKPLPPLLAQINSLITDVKGVSHQLL
jgi:hypothetical protein